MARRPRQTSVLDELHLRAGQLDHVAVLEAERLGTQGGAVDCGLDRPFNQGHHVAMGAPRDRSHGHTRFADRCHHLDQRHFATCGRTRHHLDGSAADLSCGGFAALDCTRVDDRGLFVVLGRAIVDKLDLVLANFNRVTVLQLLLLDGFAVDVAVGST